MKHVDYDLCNRIADLGHEINELELTVDGIFLRQMQPCMAFAPGLRLNVLHFQVLLERLDIEPGNAGSLTGRGCGAFKSGEVYDGDWVDGHMSGQGCITFPDGLTYKGEFLHSAITGFGVSA